MIFTLSSRRLAYNYPTPLLNSPSRGGKLSPWVPRRDCNATGMKSSRWATAFCLFAAPAGSALRIARLEKLQTKVQHKPR